MRTFCASRTSYRITSSRIILEQGTLASHSLFKHKHVSEAIFSIAIIDLGKMCNIQSSPATFFAVAVFTVVNQWIQRFFVEGKPSIHVISLCTPLTIMDPESETAIPVTCCADAANGTFGTK